MNFGLLNTAQVSQIVLMNFRPVQVTSWISIYGNEPPLLEFFTAQASTWHGKLYDKGFMTRLMSTFLFQ